MDANHRWWESAVVYQIYPRSFCDTSGNGIGDLEGVIAHLDHLSWLGVDALWLSPFYPSPGADFGYDVSDFCDVDPLFGDLATFDTLLAEAHRLDIKVVVDWVPNHTSDEHPWFVDARSSTMSDRRDFYVWQDPGPDGGPPNNWVESLTMGPAWTLDDATGQYYLHCFLPRQPDLNWSNPAVADAMCDTLRFWLDRGVDGFRMDVVHLIGKDPEFADAPPEVAGLPQVVLNDRPETHAHLRRIRSLLDSYEGDRMAVGEVYLLDTDVVASYGGPDELNLCFNFPPLLSPFSAPEWRHHIATAEEAFGRNGVPPTWVISNHDNPRHRTRWGGRLDVAGAAAVLLIGLRGPAFLYAGEELGLLDALIGDDERRDPAGRDGCRAPIPWTDRAPHGWTATPPWLPWPPNPELTNARALAADPTSILHLYRRLIDLRHRERALVEGSLALEEVHDDIVSFERRAGDEAVGVLVNMSDAPIPLPSGRPLLCSSATEPAPQTLGPFEGRIERR